MTAKLPYNNIYDIFECYDSEQLHNYIINKFHIGSTQTQKL